MGRPPPRPRDSPTELDRERLGRGDGAEFWGEDRDYYTEVVAMTVPGTPAHTCNYMRAPRETLSTSRG